MIDVKAWELSDEELRLLGGGFSLAEDRPMAAAQNAKSIREMVKWLRRELAINSQLPEVIATLYSAAVAAGYEHDVITLL